MSENPLVTIICLCYNHAEFLIESLESAKNQTYKPIQIILADDCSTDNSVAKIKEWLKNNDAQFIENKKNIGNTKTFNNALKLAKGEYIVDLATDDILLPTFVEDQVYKFKITKYKNVGVVYSNIEHIEENGNHMSYLYDVDKNKNALKKPHTGDVYKHIIYSYFLSATSMLIKTDVLKKLGGYDENLRYEDVDFWFRSSRIYEYDYVDKVLMKKRFVKQSLSSNFKKRKGVNLGMSTYKICRKGFYLNQNKEEHIALKNKVIYELKLAIKNLEVLVSLNFFYLLFRIQLKILF